MEQAVAAVCSKSDGRSVPQIAADFAVPPSSLYHRLGGRLSRRDAHADSRFLSPDDEQVLIRAIEQLAAGNFAPTRQYVAALAQELLDARDPAGGVQLGEHWVDRFLKRCPGITSVWSRPLEAGRANAEDETILVSFLERLRDRRRLDDVDRDNLWNMDETGFVLGKTSSCKVLTRQGQIKHDRRAREAGNRNFATVCECVSASGRVLTPLVILKGSSGVVSSALLAANLSGKEMFVVGSPKGWTDSDIFGKWLREVFELETRSVRRRLLLLDGHRAHVSLASL